LGCGVGLACHCLGWRHLPLGSGAPEGAAVGPGVLLGGLGGAQLLLWRGAGPAQGDRLQLQQAEEPGGCTGIGDLVSQLVHKPLKAVQAAAVDPLLQQLQTEPGLPLFDRLQQDPIRIGV
jgi:hypothetical protein